ncbi:MAG: iron-siderophore ABC transporter substrate-binding protein [Cyanobacteria bacterium P01_H01_bin.21]
MRITQLTRLLLLGIATLSACQNNSEQLSSAPAPLQPVDCRTIEHALGNTDICGQPQRIVVLGPYVLEPLLALSVQPIAFGDHITLHQGEYDEPSQHIPYLGDHITQPIANVGTAFNPSIEAILKLQPDLILGTSTNNAAQYKTLSDIAPTLLLNWSETEKNLKTIAQAVEQTNRSEQLEEEKEKKIEATRQAFAPLIADYPKVLILISAQFPELYIGNQAAGSCSSLIQEMGFELVLLPQSEDTEAPRTPISIETLPELNDADIILILGSNFDTVQSFSSIDEFETHQLSNVQKDWEKNAIAQSLTASKAGRVYFVPAYLCLGLPGPIGTELYLDELKTQLLLDKQQ